MKTTRSPLCPLVLAGALTMTLAPVWVHASLITGLQGYWTFDETTGTTAANSGSTGTASDGALQNLNFATDSVAGRIGNALDLSGGWVDFSDASNPIILDSVMSMAAWVKIEFPATEGRTYVSGHMQNSAGNRGATWYVNNDGSVSAITYDPGIHQDTSPAGLVTDSTWHHLVWTRDGSVNRLFVDGVLQNSEAFSSGGLLTGSGTRPLAANTGFTSEGTFNENLILDELRIYNRALSDGSVAVGQTAGGEVAQLYGLAAVPEASEALVVLLGMTGLLGARRRSR